MGYKKNPTIMKPLVGMEGLPAVSWAVLA